MINTTLCKILKTIKFGLYGQITFFEFYKNLLSIVLLPFQPKVQSEVSQYNVAPPCTQTYIEPQFEPFQISDFEPIRANSYINTIKSTLITIKTHHLNGPLYINFTIQPKPLNLINDHIYHNDRASPADPSRAMHDNWSWSLLTGLTG